MSTTYKGCVITRTEIVCANNNRRIYEISGRLTKRTTPRPFLTTIKDAKEWIAYEDMVASRGWER